MYIDLVTPKEEIVRVFTDTLDITTTKQIIEMADAPAGRGANIRIMPDAHAGKGCVIGTTMIVRDKVVPYYIGVDIGCGLLVNYLGTDEINLEQLDEVIRRNVPSGFRVRKILHSLADQIPARIYEMQDIVDVRRAECSIGTLGGGNHFIELSKRKNGQHILSIHTGSRKFGLEIAEYYQKQAQIYCDDLGLDIKKEHCYLEGDLMQDYLRDMRIAQEYATINRKAIANSIQRGMNWAVLKEFSTVHNYIDDNMILRKGAINADYNRQVIIPMNMSFGSILATGKGNADWNYSSAHGAGRIMSRNKARKEINMREFQESMQGIYTTCVNRNTIDEAPMAYKNPKKVIAELEDTIEVIETLKPIYNFKDKGN